MVRVGIGQGQRILKSRDSCPEGDSVLVQVGFRLARVPFIDYDFSLQREALSGPFLNTLLPQTASCFKTKPARPSTLRLLKLPPKTALPDVQARFPGQSNQESDTSIPCERPTSFLIAARIDTRAGPPF